MLRIPQPAFRSATPRLSSPAEPRLRPVAWTTVLCGGLAIAAADLAYCILFWSPQGVPPVRILQGVAAGAFGTASFTAGAATVIAGAFFQWLIGCAFVLAYALVAIRVDLLRRHPRRYGVAYGLLLYLVMNRIVVPLSAYPEPELPNMPWILGNIPAFAVFGMLAAAFARSALVRHRA